MRVMTPMDEKVYREELQDILPQKIFDAHVHIFEKDFLREDYITPATSVYRRFGDDFSLSLWREIMQEILPGKEVYLNCFGRPNPNAYHDRIPKVNHQTEFVMTLVSPADDIADVKRRIETSGSIGVKPYLNYAASFYGKAPNDVEIYDMLTSAQLEYLNEKGLAVTLHIPRSGRFADKLNQRQMIGLCEKYPDIKFIFAHIGRAYFMRNIIDSNIEEFAAYPNAYFDTAMVNSAEILQYTYDHFPIERVLFGTDTPIALLHGKSVEINNQYAYVMGENYKIGSTIFDADGVVKFTTFFYEQLRAVIAATPRDKLSDVLFNNAYKLFTEIKK